MPGTQKSQVGWLYSQHGALGTTIAGLASAGKPACPACRRWACCLRPKAPAQGRPAQAAPHGAADAVPEEHVTNRGRVRREMKGMLGVGAPPFRPASQLPAPPLGWSPAPSCPPAWSPAQSRSRPCLPLGGQEAQAGWPRPAGAVLLSNRPAPDPPATIPPSSLPFQQRPLAALTFRRVVAQVVGHLLADGCQAVFPFIILGRPPVASARGSGVTIGSRSVAPLRPLVHFACLAGWFSVSARQLESWRATRLVHWVLLYLSDFCVAGVGRGLK